MDDECDIRRWDDLIPDVLGLVFRNLSLEEMLSVVPRVCKSWGRAVMEPLCWQAIDIDEWSQICDPDLIDQMVHLLVDRSCGSLTKLSVSGISTDQTFSFIANHSKSLQTLCVPRSKISNSIVEDVAVMLSNVTVLDLSYCMNIGAQALEAIGNHCKFLSVLRRVMHPIDVIDKHPQDDEALAVACTMPNLKHLEIAYLLVETTSVIEILKQCTQLELLDVRGCWHVYLDEKFLKKFPKVKVQGPQVVDCYYLSGWESCSELSMYSGYLAWEFMSSEEYGEMSDGYWEEEQQTEDVEMWFHGDGQWIDV